jgi:hypothetical protein
MECQVVLKVWYKMHEIIHPNLNMQGKNLNFTQFNRICIESYVKSVKSNFAELW